MPRRFGFMVVLVLLLSALLAGCGSSGPGPKDVADQFFKAITSGNWEAAEGLLSADSGSDLAKPAAGEERIVNALMSKISYELGEAQVQGDQAVVALDLTLPDMERLSARLLSEVLPLAFSAGLSEDLTDEQLDLMVEEKFVEILNDKDLAMVTYEGSVTLVKEAGGWKVLAVDGLDQDVSFFN
ncbi:hypothetical protein J2Z79_002279 [Symbiobacterium terraclitae]|uniref:Lipoprotein n=1 Tax=Symbiobacterium terraclitae TaxID=557451 RepID=A0ABS4JTK3_9FIRM|nr:hypothetical protein [Symbiobacterium terraclitae]MBP2018864.1 hypothetical protein [Symbiobacterium terraclitae]